MSDQDQHEDYTVQATEHIREAKRLLLLGGGRPMVEAIERLTAAEILLIQPCHADCCGEPTAALRWIRRQRQPLLELVPKAQWPMLYRTLIESRKSAH